ncbi:MAG: CAP domain-containing protein [Synechococcaceae cyanobacterium SM2_3_1]|nr:CAP domain-containing protein [Synechococcaceae cyanobacterium SM2_3_1]
MSSIRGGPGAQRDFCGVDNDRCTFFRSRSHGQGNLRLSTTSSQCQGNQGQKLGVTHRQSSFRSDVTIPSLLRLSTADDLRDRRLGNVLPSGFAFMPTMPDWRSGSSADFIPLRRASTMPQSPWLSTACCLGLILMITACSSASDEGITAISRDAIPAAASQPPASLPVTRATAAGYAWIALGENIAQGQTAPEQVMQSWMASEGHRSNILNPVFEEIGVGDAIAPRTGNPYWVQLFGCGAVTP